MDETSVYKREGEHAAVHIKLILRLGEGKTHTDEINHSMSGGLISKHPSIRDIHFTRQTSSIRIEYHPNHHSKKRKFEKETF